jgi:molybdopterin synthase catalytic subunit
MKNKMFDCVAMKREAQERIYEETRHMTAEEKIAFYHRIGDVARQRQTELRAKLNLTPQPA